MKKKKTRLPLITVFYYFYCLFRYLYPQPSKIFSLPSTLLLFFHFLKPSFFQVCVKRGTKNIKIPSLAPHLILFQRFFFLSFIPRISARLSLLTYVLAAESSKILILYSRQEPVCIYISYIFLHALIQSAPN